MGQASVGLGSETDDSNNANHDHNEQCIYVDISTSIGTQQALFNRVITENPNRVENVIFFGGDVQDYDKYMVQERTFKEYGDYALESVSDILRLKFPNSNILIIRPCSRNTHISIFSNFIANIDDHGQSVPSYKNGRGCRHLMEILEDEQLHGMDDGAVHLIGFSRGVNVLNQLLYETDPRNKERKYVDTLFDRVSSMYFLDGGNGGKFKTLPVDDSVIAHFVDNVINDGFQFHVYGTSYQWKDQRRPWIGEEQRYFVELIKMLRDRDSQIKQRKQYSLHHHMYADEELNQSLVQNDVSAFKTSKLKALFRHFELLRLFNVQSLKYLL